MIEGECYLKKGENPFGVGDGMVKNEHEKMVVLRQMMYLEPNGKLCCKVHVPADDRSHSVVKPSADFLGRRVSGRQRNIFRPPRHKRSIWCLNGKPLFGAARRLRAGNFAIQREILRNTGQPPDLVRVGRSRSHLKKLNPMNEGFILCFLLENARPNHAFGVISGGFRQVPAASQNSPPSGSGCNQNRVFRSGTIWEKKSGSWSMAWNRAASRARSSQRPVWCNATHPVWGKPSSSQIRNVSEFGPSSDGSQIGFCKYIPNQLPDQLFSNCMRDVAVIIIESQWVAIDLWQLQPIGIRYNINKRFIRDDD